MASDATGAPEGGPRPGVFESTSYVMRQFGLDNARMSEKARRNVFNAIAASIITERSNNWPTEME